MSPSVGAAERDVSMVFQSYALFPHMSVLENVRYGLVVSGVPKPPTPTSARARRSRPSGSTGSTTACRRSSRAASSSASPSPARWCSSPRCCCSTSRCRTSTRGCAARCARRSATCSSGSALTVVYVTHDQAEAMAVSDRIVVMNRARDRAGRRAARALRGAARCVRRGLHGRREPRARHARAASTTPGGPPHSAR